MGYRRKRGLPDSPYLSDWPPWAVVKHQLWSTGLLLGTAYAGVAMGFDKDSSIFVALMSVWVGLLRRISGGAVAAVYGVSASGFLVMFYQGTSFADLFFLAVVASGMYVVSALAASEDFYLGEFQVLAILAFQIFVTTWLLP